MKDGLKRLPIAGWTVVAGLTGFMLLPTSAPLVGEAFAQTPPQGSTTTPASLGKVRLNPVIEKLAAGKPFIGVST